MCLRRKELSQLQPHLKRFAFSLTRNREHADDLVQDCILRALEKEHLFEAGSDLRRWMFALMRNIFLDGKRREKTRLRYSDDLADFLQTIQPAQQFDQQYLRDTLVAVDSLSKHERQAVHLLCVEGLSLAEASRLKTVPVGTLKSRLSRGRNRLRKLLDDGDKAPLRPRPQSVGSMAR